MTNAHCSPYQLTTAQAAAYLGISQATLETWRSTRRVPLKFAKVGGRVRYSLGDLDEFVQARVAVHTGPRAEAVSE